MATHRWIVTYTKHVKQKRKVYQDGVLELCSSTGTPQVILYDECEKHIDRRFLKKDEIIKSGGTLSFETHIVEIGDPDGSKMPSAESNVKPCIQPVTEREDLNHSKKVTNNCSSKVGKFINTTAPLRDAWHILSVLKRPSPEGNLLLEVPLVEQDLTSQSTDKCQLDLQEKCGIAPLNVRLLTSVQPADDYHEELSAFSSEITGTSARHGLKSADSQGPHVSANILVPEADSDGSSSADDHSSSSRLSGIFTLETSQTKSSPMNEPDTHITDLGFSQEVLHYMNPIVFLEKSLEDSNGEHQLCASACSHLKEKKIVDESSNLPGMDTKSILSYSPPSQLCTKFTKAGAFAASDAAKDPEIVNSPELANMKDFPTFDLGF